MYSCRAVQCGSIVRDAAVNFQFGKRLFVYDLIGRWHTFLTFSMVLKKKLCCFWFIVLLGNIFGYLNVGMLVRSDIFILKMMNFKLDVLIFFLLGNYQSFK